MLMLIFSQLSTSRHIHTFISRETEKRFKTEFFFKFSHQFSYLTLVQTMVTILAKQHDEEQHDETTYVSWLICEPRKLLRFIYSQGLSTTYYTQQGFSGTHFAHSNKPAISKIQNYRDPSAKQSTFICLNIIRFA